MKRVLMIGMILLAVYCVLTAKAYFVPDPDEIEPQRFSENQEMFETIVRYYKTLDYAILLKENQDEEMVLIDNIQYEVYVGEDFCSLNLVGDSYEFFYNNLLGGQSIEQVIGNFHGLRIDIKKENFQVDIIRVEISDFDTDYYSILCWYNDVDINSISADRIIALPGNWYILRKGLV